MAATKNFPEVKAAIVESVRNGAYAKHAAQAAGIGETTLWEWQQADAAFAETITRARAEAVNAMVRVVGSAAADGDWRAAGWYLERTQPEDFRERKATELTGANGGPIEVAEVPLDAERAEAVAAILKSTGAAG